MAESKAFRLINSPTLTDCLDSLSHRCNVASLSIFYRYFHASCYLELTNCMPQLLRRPRCIRLSTSSHPYPVHLSNTRVNQYLHFFISYIGKLWKSLPFFSFSTCLWLELFQKKECQDTSNAKLDLHRLPVFLLLFSVQGLATNVFF